MPNPHVNKVVQSNGTTLIDISDTTAVASDVASGKYFYLASGEKVEGTASGGGGGSSYQLENIVPLQSITTDTAVSRGYGGYITQYTGTITPNEMYLITFDGTQYVCMGFIGDSLSYNAGDYRIYTSTTALRYMITPFCVVYTHKNNAYFLATRDTNAHTLQIDKLTLL